MDCYHTLFLIPGLPFVEYPSRQTSHGGTAPERPREELCFLEGLCWLAATAASTSRAASTSSKPSSSVNTPASASRPTMHVVHYFRLMPSVRSQLKRTCVSTCPASSKPSASANTAALAPAPAPHATYTFYPSLCLRFMSDEMKEKSFSDQC